MLKYVRLANSMTEAIIINCVDPFMLFVLKLGEIRKCVMIDIIQAVQEYIPPCLIYRITIKPVPYIQYSIRVCSFDR